LLGDSIGLPIDEAGCYHAFLFEKSDAIFVCSAERRRSIWQHGQQQASKGEEKSDAIWRLLWLPSLFRLILAPMLGSENIFVLLQVCQA
jgi:hypothetical protein